MSNCRYYTKHCVSIIADTVVRKDAGSGIREISNTGEPRNIANSGTRKIASNGARKK